MWPNLINSSRNKHDSVLIIFDVGSKKTGLQVNFGTFWRSFLLEVFLLSHSLLRASIWQLLASLHDQTSLEGPHIPLLELLSECLRVSDGAKAPSAHDA